MVPPGRQESKGNAKAWGKNPIHDNRPGEPVKLDFRLAHSTFNMPFLVVRGQGPCAQKASAQLFRIADFGFRIFWVFFFNPHSAIGIPQFEGGPIGRPKFGIRKVEFGIFTSFFPFRIPQSAFRI